MLTGDPLFPEDDPRELSAQILTSPIQLPAALGQVEVGNLACSQQSITLSTNTLDGVPGRAAAEGPSEEAGLLAEGGGGYQDS